MGLRDLLPPPVKAAIKRVWLSGSDRLCPVCGRSSRRFLEQGTMIRRGERCPWCQSLGRHRLVWWYLQSRTDLFDGRPKRVLHLAPERCLEPRLRAAIGDGYLTGDPKDPLAMERFDITDIRHPDDSFDVVYCSRGLEHVPDDRRAMAELRRVLKPGGWSVLVTTIEGDRTVEDVTITDPQERRWRFGHADRFRACGLDYLDRLRAAGFTVRHVRPAELISAEDARRIGVDTLPPFDILHCS